MDEAVREVREIVTAHEPGDPVEAAHRDDVLGWLAGTDDVYRRAKPDVPPKHLVSYVLLTDHVDGSVLLAEHRRSGLRLPAGGHVEPGEHPVDTARRETAEELGIDAVFSPVVGPRPAFLTVTGTRAREGRHTDVSLWYVLAGHRDQPLVPDPREFAGVRWWSPAALAAALAADPDAFDPHQGRMAARLAALLTPGSAPPGSGRAPDRG